MTGLGGVVVVGQAAVRRDISLGEWLLDPSTWTGANGVLASGWDTLVLCAAVVAVSVVLAVPAGAVLAHGRRAPVLSAWLVNIGRAVPPFAVAAVLVPVSLRAGFGFEPWPIFTALTLMTVPPIFVSTYVAVEEVDRGAVEAARAMGFRPRDVLLQVEVPLAATVIFTGIRVAAVQVVATEPIRAFLGGDGLGRYVRDGIGQNNATLVIGGTILIAALAGATGLAFTAFERFVKPSGVRRLGHHADRRPDRRPGAGRDADEEFTGAPRGGHGDDGAAARGMR